MAVSSFRLRARLGFSIPSHFSGQRGITPAFGYSAPHPGAGGTLTLLNSALLSAHYDSNPTSVADATWVDDQEIVWMKDNINNADARKTILLSHHQLFSVFEKIGGNAVNQKLLPKCRTFFPN